jgi:hypothetical protein
MVTETDDMHDDDGTATVESRTIRCGEKRITIRRFPDGVIGVFDEAGRMIVGWPETTMFGSLPLDEGEDAAWCATIGRVRKIG